MSLDINDIKEFFDKTDELIVEAKNGVSYGTSRILSGSKVILHKGSLSTKGKKCRITILGEDGEPVLGKDQKPQYVEYEASVIVLLQTFAPKILAKLEEKNKEQK